MRISEVLVKKETEADMLQNLLEIDVEVTDSNATIWLRNAKFQSKMGAMIVIPKLDSYPSLCPVRALKAYLKRRQTVTKDHHLPLFISDAPPYLAENKHMHKFYTSPRFQKDINQAINALGDRAKSMKEELVLHSLRSGIPTTLQRKGKVIDPTLMKAMGRWHSMAYEVYLKDHASALLMAEKAGQAIINKLVEDGEEHDPSLNEEQDLLPEEQPAQPVPSPRQKRRKKLARTKTWQQQRK